MRPMPRLLTMLLLMAPLAAAADCPPGGWDRDALAALKAEGFAGLAPARRDALAIDLLACLGDPDPTLRDGIAYEAMASWLRADPPLSHATREALLDALLPRLSVRDDAGFEAPFAALVLSEVARTDRIAPWLAPARRAGLVEAAAAYVEGVRDYRGFTDGEGWRHGVAHGADLLMQLAMNPALDKPQLSRLLQAVSAQVAPVAAPPYVHGESERLVRPVLFVLQRGLHDDGEWRAWISGLVAPAADAAGPYGSEAALARRHNQRGFLLALYVALDASGSEALQARVPAVLDGLRALP
ncbi:MAG TPA: DUF2785 domain-containing protein [Arenimonas sp.]|uniref:DUF2785 domain-containing protein n=1 Tax=Arenimonas sp. TaxID=1872635 RepID=UPI002D7FE7E1|nr:DUF2785 domain-containing protein [Arenimonas sp.]HEU0151742.1 DUF2785 domain-containing protein [Arenimonas sp.]